MSELKCPVCGFSLRDKEYKCPKCRYIVDKNKYNKALLIKILGIIAGIIGIILLIKDGISGLNNSTNWLG